MWAFNLGCKSFTLLTTSHFEYICTGLGEVVGYILRKYSALHPRGLHGLLSLNYYI